MNAPGSVGPDTMALDAVPIRLPGNEEAVAIASGGGTVGRQGAKNVYQPKMLRSQIAQSCESPQYTVAGGQARVGGRRPNVKNDGTMSGSQKSTGGVHSLASGLRLNPLQSFQKNACPMLGRQISCRPVIALNYPQRAPRPRGTAATSS